MARLRVPLTRLRLLLARLARRLFSRENWWALLLCLIMIALVIFSAGSDPLWIYQGF